MKRFLLIMMVLISLVLLSGCGKSKFEQLAEEAQNIKITVDQKTMNEMNQKIQNFKNGN